MSKAFTKESDDEDDLDPQDGEAAAPPAKNYMTPAGYRRMNEELSRLWERSSLTRDELLKELQDWCARAEASAAATAAA